jgi:MFS family permease
MFQVRSYGEVVIQSNNTTTSSQSATVEGGHGWVVVAATFVIVFLGFGAAYSFTVFFPFLEREFGASREQVSLTFSIAGFLYFVLGALSGPLADRFGTRPIVMTGMLIAGGSLVLGTFSRSLTETYLTFGVGFGVGIGFAYVPAVGAVQRWFVAKRGMAGGMAVAGIGVGTLAMPPIAAFLIDYGGWRYAYLVMGVALLSLGLMAAFRIEDPPAYREARNAGGGGLDGSDLWPALRSRAFILFWLSSLMLSIGLFVPFVHLVPYAIDRGLGAGTGILLLSLIGVGSTVGRFVLAGFADRIGRRRALVIMYSGVGLMDLVWLWGGSIEALYLFAVVYGLCYGGFVGTAPAVSADLFGTKKVSSIIGWLYTSVAVGTLLGPPLAGRAFDLYQSYDLPIIVGAISGLTAAVIMLFVGSGQDSNSVAD